MEVCYPLLFILQKYSSHRNIILVKGPMTKLWAISKNTFINVIFCLELLFFLFNKSNFLWYRLETIHILHLVLQRKTRYSLAQQKTLVTRLYQRSANVLSWSHSVSSVIADITSMLICATLTQVRIQNFLLFITISVK